MAIFCQYSYVIGLLFYLDVQCVKKKVSQLNIIIMQQTNGCPPLKQCSLLDLHSISTNWQGMGIDYNKWDSQYISNGSETFYFNTGSLPACFYFCKLRTFMVLVTMLLCSFEHTRGSWKGYCERERERERERLRERVLIIFLMF